MPMRRARAAACDAGATDTAPASRISPAAHVGSKPAMARSTVVLPQPEGPSRQAMLPALERGKSTVVTTVCWP
jgi:hypothetical protein